MDLSIKRAMDKELEKLQLELFSCDHRSMDTFEAHCEYNSAIAKIVLNSGSLMSNQEKLKYLQADRFFPARKEIIRIMILDDGIHPNKIKYREESALSDSFTQQDLGFIEFLFKHGATVDAQLNKRVEDNPRFKKTFLDLLKQLISNSSK
jgi:hypothetical protein